MYNEYIVKDRSVKNIAEEYGCKPNTIHQWLYKYGIKKEIIHHERKPQHQYEMYDYLYHNHIELNKSVIELAKENNVSDDTIRYHLQKNKIEIQKQNQHKIQNENEIKEIIRLYCDELWSANKIAKQFNTSHTVIIRLLKKQGIQTRNLNEAQFATDGKVMPNSYYDANYLWDLHWRKNKTCKEIGELFGIDAGAIRRHMKNLGVSTKNNAQSKIGLMTGKKHPNWKGGITSLNLLLREYFHTNQVPMIAKRDNYTCQCCGKTHTVLHVHHIKHFNKIINEICDEHKELDPQNEKDKNTLYEIITHDERFLDLNNLILLCKECHFYSIHEYHKR